MSAPIAALALFYLALQIVDSVQLLILIGALLFAGTGHFIKVGRRMRSLDGAELLRRDPRPPVVYLRPFFEDERTTYDSPVGQRIGGADVTSGGARGPATREPRIARALNEIGPFVAVGKPGDRLAPLGAARLYVSDAEWRPTVESLVRRASAVVLQPETTAGTWWELILVVGIVDLRRVLMLVPDPALRPLGYHRVRSLAAAVLPVPLPENCPAADAFMFDKDGRPQPLTFGRRGGVALRPFVAQVQALPKPKGVHA